MRLGEMERVSMGAAKFLKVALTACLLAGPALWSGATAKEPSKSAKGGRTGSVANDAKIRPLQAAGSRVVMELPRAFETAPRFVGFFDEKREISFLVSDLPAEAFAKMTEGFTPALLKERGFLDPREGTLERKDRYIYRRFAQTSPNGLVQKFVLVFTDDTATGMISGNVPTTLLSSGALSERDIEAMLASARLVEKKLELPLVATLGDTATLKPALVYGQSQIWTLDGKHGEGFELSPAIVVAASATYETTATPQQYAAAALGSLAGHKNIALIGNAKPLKIGAHRGIELTASAEATKSGAQRALYQFLIPQASGGHVRFIGIAPFADKDLWFVAFRRSVASLKLKE
jgi:hypothetical protein